MLPLLIALQFLTSLPIRLPAMPEPEQQGRSLLYYPLVGLLLGALLCLAAFVLDGAPALLQAALLLTLWVALTGALHLDGLADSADAWLGGFGDRERTLQIMKDPRSGPVAVVVLVLLLLLKFSALLALLRRNSTPHCCWRRCWGGPRCQRCFSARPMCGPTALVMRWQRICRTAGRVAYWRWSRWGVCCSAAAG